MIASKESAAEETAHDPVDITRVGAEEDPGEESNVEMAGATGIKAESEGSDETATSGTRLSPWYETTKQALFSALLPFLTVKETLSLDSAVSDKEERKNLEKAYRGLRSGDFDEYVFSSRNDYEGIRWARKRGIDLWHLKLEYKGERDVDKVLGLLVMDEKKEMATYYAERSDAEDTEVRDEDDDPSFILIEASHLGYLEVVQSLTGRGADVNRGNNIGSTPLYMASDHVHLEVVRALLAAGADVNRSDRDGNTPLYRASLKGRLELVRALLAAGADVNKSDDDGQTPLSRASWNGHLEVVRALIAAGADVNRSSNYGWTPLCMASMKGHLEMVRALLAAGADVNKSNNGGETPLFRALAHSRTQIADLLRDAGAH